MTAHPIDTEALRRLADAASPLPWVLDIENEEDYEQGIPYSEYPISITGPRSSTRWADPVWQERFGSTISEVAEMSIADAEYMVSAANAIPALLDAPAAAEHRATRAEAQSEARRINAEYWKARVKAVEDVLDRWQVDGRDQLIPGESIRRALEG